MGSSKNSILYILQSLSLGGTESYIRYLSRYLHSHYNLHFISTVNPEIHSEFHSLGQAHYIKSHDSILSYMRRNHISIVQYANLPEYGKIAQEAKVPVIIERIAGPRSIKPTHYCRHIISSSQGIVSAIRKTWTGDISIIKNGVYYDPNILAERPLKGFVLVYPAARMGDGQAYDHLISATLKARKQNPNIRLILMGGKPNQKGYPDILPRLKKLTKPLLQDKACVFTGALENPLPVIKGCDVICCPAKTHGISNGLIEGAYYSKPLIASDVGQTREICMNGKNGLLFRFGDIETLTQHIVKLAGNKELYAEYAKNSFSIADKEHNAEKQAKKHKELYDSLLSRC